MEKNETYLVSFFVFMEEARFSSALFGGAYSEMLFSLLQDDVKYVLRRMIYSRVDRE